MGLNVVSLAQHTERKHQSDLALHVFLAMYHTCTILTKTAYRSMSVTALVAVGQTLSSTILTRTACRFRTTTPPRAQYQVNNMIHPYSILHLRENRRSSFPTKKAVSTCPSHQARTNDKRQTHLIFLASRSMTPRSAPTISAKSVLFTTNKSLCVIPGPPFLGILSPPLTSITYTIKSASSRE